MNPIEYAQRMIEVLGEADSNTAHVALKIAALLVEHRDHHFLSFDRDLTSGQSSGLFGIAES